MPMPSASGNMPAIIAAVVMRMGRRRVCPASTMASLRAMPSRVRRWTKSTSRMEFFVTNPISMMMPMIENRFSVLPHSNNARNTPTSDRGSAVMMVMGCRKLLNWVARIM